MRHIDFIKAFVRGCQYSYFDGENVHYCQNGKVLFTEPTTKALDKPLNTLTFRRKPKIDRPQGVPNIGLDNSKEVVRTYFEKQYDTDPEYRRAVLTFLTKNNIKHGRMKYFFIDGNYNNDSFDNVLGITKSRLAEFIEELFGCQENY